jgi:hypothetical protein
MERDACYVGIDHDRYGGMTEIGKLIRDAWAFMVIPETETCQGWTAHKIQDLADKVHERWREYGFSVSNLPEVLRERHVRIHDEGIRLAREAGWDPELDDES